MGALLRAGGEAQPSVLSDSSQHASGSHPGFRTAAAGGVQGALQGAAARERLPWGPLGRAPLPRAPDGSLPECGPPTQAGGEPRLPRARQLPGAAAPAVALTGFGS